MAKQLEFNRIGKRKKPNYKKSLILIILLIVALFLYTYAEDWIVNLFKK